MSNGPGSHESPASAGGPVIETKDLAKHFRRIEAVRGINLDVPKGSVYGFLGRNGAGKSTTIRMLLGLLTPEAGSSAVLGLDPMKKALAIKQRTGYVPESPVLYRWMTVKQFLWFVSGFFPRWDPAFAEDLRKRFQLDESQKVGALSKGMAAKLNLLTALAHRPELLILDDPTMGLDVVVRREFLENIVTAIQEENRTVFISTHQIDEVERVADHIGIIHEGRILWQGTLEALKESVKRIRITFAEGFRGLNGIEGVLTSDKGERDWSGIVSGIDDEKISQFKGLPGVTGVEAKHIPLEDIFCALVGGGS